MPVMRRVGVRVAVAEPRVTMPGGVRVPVIGRVFVSSTVGVCVGSRVGIGACVGVGSKVPPGKLMNVGGGLVAVDSNAARVMTVGVEARCPRLGRIKMLTVPAQYITIAPITAMARQP